MNDAQWVNDGKYWIVVGYPLVELWIAGIAKFICHFGNRHISEMANDRLLIVVRGQVRIVFLQAFMWISINQDGMVLAFFIGQPYVHLNYICASFIESSVVPTCPNMCTTCQETACLDLNARNLLFFLFHGVLLLFSSTLPSLLSL